MVIRKLKINFTSYFFNGPYIVILYRFFQNKLHKSRISRVWQNVSVQKIFLSTSTYLVPTGTWIEVNIIKLKQFHAQWTLKLNATIV